MSLKLSDYDKIIFDLDSVITSEMSYWQTAATGAYDLLLSHEHFGKCGIDRAWCRKQYIEIFNTIMCGGRTIRAVKRLGVNTNWDLLYIIFCVSKYLNPELDTMDATHFQSVCMFIENIDLKAPEVYDALAGLAEQVMPGLGENYFKRSGDGFWQKMLDVYDVWYDGTDEFEGIKASELLLFPDEDLDKMLRHLQEHGIEMGIGSGRMDCEIEPVLTKHGIYKYFDRGLSASYDDVTAAEKELKPAQPLAKPDPFVFLKAALGKTHTNREIADGEYTYEELSRTLIVGDAPSDLISAKRGGFSFLGVLTGIEGEGMRSYFEENGADYIMDNVLGLTECED